MVITREKAYRVRLKLAASMMTTMGYAVLGASAVQPLLAAGPLGGVRIYVGFVIGIVMEGLALYIAPHGEEP